MKYSVIIRSQTHHEVLDTFDTKQEAIDFCNQWDYPYTDVNDFVWDMYIQEVEV